MTGPVDIRVLDCERHMWAPDDAERIELQEHHGYARAVRLLNTPAQRAHRLSSVESVFSTDDESLADYHRRHRA